MRRSVVTTGVLVALLTGLLGASPARAAQLPEGPLRELSLQDAVELAAAQNLGIRIQAATLEVQRQNRRAVWAAYHPTFALGLDYTAGVDHSLQQIAGSLLESLYHNYGLVANTSLSNRFVTGTTVTLAWYHSSTRSERKKDEFQELLEGISGISDPIQTQFAGRGSITVEQSLLQGLGWWYNLGPIEQAKLAESREEVAYDAQVADVLGGVVKAYFELHYAERAVAIAQSHVDLALAQREVTQAQIEAGNLPPIELAKLDETVATRRQELLEAEMSRRRTEITLRTLLCGDEGSPTLEGVRYHTAEYPRSAVPERDLEASLQTALTRNPDVRQQELLLQSQQIAFRMARQDLLPTLDFTGSLALNGVGEDSPEGLEDVFGGNHPYWSFGLQLTVPLTNRGAETDFRSRKAEVEAALLTLKQLQESTLAEVENTYTQVLSYEEQLRVAGTRVDLAAQNVEAEEARYAAGKSTTREVLEVQQSLRDAQLAEVRAEINALNARVDLELLRGTLLESLGVREIAD